MGRTTGDYNRGPARVVAFKCAITEEGRRDIREGIRREGVGARRKR